MDIKSDYLVIGSGISGLVFALRVAEHGTVSLITKLSIADTNTQYAQGGIAAVWHESDTVNLHFKDTISAGDGLCHPSVVKSIVKKGPKVLKSLIEDYNIKMDIDENGSYELGLEGAHSKRRVLHSKDSTGKEFQQKLSNAVKKHPNINVFPNHMAINLYVENDKCYGAYVLDTKAKVIINFTSKVTILATGGAGKAYLYTSNPDIATGDGVAMAYRAGAKIMNMEFTQFHPTCLYHPYAKSSLISEALRGEGATLVDSNGKRFMDKYHPLKELASRDIVARSIDHELKITGKDCVYLDITHRGKKFIQNRFPGIYEKCLSFGIDITEQAIPVVPAAHYSIGGVEATVEGVTNIKNLLAIGEVSCTGFHGANRLASNSLLEGIVCASNAAEFANNLLKKNIFDKKRFPYWDSGSAEASNERVIIAQNWEEIRRFLWNFVGIVRSDSRLERAKKRSRLVLQEINQYYWDFKVTSDLLELRNISLVTDLIIKSALARKESRGVHFSLDYPKKLPEAMDTILQISMVEKRRIQNGY